MLDGYDLPINLAFKLKYFISLYLQSVEEELNRKKEKFIQMQIKRKEEQDKKRQYKELEMSRRKEQERQVYFI